MENRKISFITYKKIRMSSTVKDIEVILFRYCIKYDIT